MHASLIAFPKPSAHYTAMMCASAHQVQQSQSIQQDCEQRPGQIFCATLKYAMTMNMMAFAALSYTQRRFYERDTGQDEPPRDNHCHRKAAARRRTAVHAAVRCEGLRGKVCTYAAIATIILLLLLLLPLKLDPFPNALDSVGDPLFVAEHKDKRATGLSKRRSYPWLSGGSTGPRYHRGFSMGMGKCGKAAKAKVWRLAGPSLLKQSHCAVSFGTRRIGYVDLFEYVRLDAL